MGINGICVAWTTGGANQTASIFAAKLAWSPAQTRFNNTLINFMSQIGKALGAFYGGKIIPSGRKRVFVVFNVLAILSCLVMQILNVYTIALGKLMHGFFVTVVHLAAIKMVNETVPVYLLGSCGTVLQTSTALGYMLVLGFGLGLPPADYDPAVSDSVSNQLAF